MTNSNSRRARRGRRGRRVRTQEWDYDRKGLERSLADWSEEILFGVAEIVDRFWASDLNDGRSPRQRLEECDAKISG